MCNRHERVIAAPPERIAALIADFDRPDAVRAFRVLRPDGLHVEHWFELERVKGAAILRHTLEGRAVGEYEAIWRERIEPYHDRVLEALLDNVEAAFASGA